MTDNYEFSKSTFPQGLDTETPYVSKNWNYINDINGGIYSNSGLSLCQFDLSSLYNSTNLVQPDAMFLAIPITYVSAFVTNAGALTAPIAGSWASTALKSGYFQLIHGADLALNGKTVNQFQPYTNAYVGFKTLSMMSQDDLKTLGTTLGMGSELDNPQSLVFNGSAVANASGAFPSSVVAGGIGGNGISNNKPFAINPEGQSDFADQSKFGSQNANTYNNGLQSRMKKVIDTTQTGQYLFGASGTAGTSYITNVDNTKKEFKPYYTVNNTNYATWYDVAIVRLSDIFDSMKQLPLTKKLDAIARFYINTGTVVSNIVASAGGVSTGLQMSSGLGNTFTNTCPLIHTCLGGATAVYPVNAGAIVSGLFVGTPTATSVSAYGLSGINLASGTQSHFLTSCRIYYPQIQLKPERLLPYISENRAKKVVYTDFLTNTVSAVSAGSTYSGLIQSGVSNIRGILVLPFISATTNGGTIAGGGTGITAFSQLLSPFDTAPMTSAPISLLNLQVAIGGVNVLANPISTGWEEFLEQMVLYEKINGLDYGLSCGLINENYFQQAYRPFYIDCSRANIADMMTPRNVNITFTNNSLQTIDALVFTEYFKEIVIDVETGLINV
jgi:hypothetical protein